MSLTYEEEKRIRELEDTLTRLENLITHAASEVMLNRLLTLANEENRRTRQSLELLEEKVNTLISLAQKLQ